MKKIFSLAIIACLAFASCSKEKTDSNPGNPGNPVSKKLTHTTVNGDINLSYNADGTLHDMTRVIGAYTYKYIYTYSPGKVNYVSNQQTPTGWKKSEIGEYTIANGRPTTFVWTYFDAYENPISTFTESFIYNAKGLLARRNFTGNVHSIYTYDAQDNMILSEYYDDMNVNTGKTEYTYGSQKDLFPGLNWVRSYGDGFFLPQISKNLPLTQKGTDLVTNTISYHTTFTYVLDADGYVKTGKADDAVSGTSYSWDNIFVIK